MKKLIELLLILIAVSSCATNQTYTIPMLYGINDNGNHLNKVQQLQNNNLVLRENNLQDLLKSKLDSVGMIIQSNKFTRGDKYAFYMCDIKEKENGIVLLTATYYGYYLVHPMLAENVKGIYTYTYGNDQKAFLVVCMSGKEAEVKLFDYIFKNKGNVKIKMKFIKDDGLVFQGTDSMVFGFQIYAYEKNGKYEVALSRTIDLTNPKGRITNPNR